MGRQETPNSEIWESALEKLLLMNTAKSENLEFLPKLSGDFSNIGDARVSLLGFVLRPETDPR
jgi:hypothetical protein